MRFVDLIVKKREGEPLTTAEINFWIESYVKNQVPDYQVSALLMAIVLNGMNERETKDLTMAMMNSGDQIDLSGIDGIKVDKHSTGGVGDKTSLVLGPMVAACNARLAKMSGRGLGHTGGTLDKLESIEGFNCYLDRDAFIRQVNEIGLAIIGQTGNLVPADKKLYALRDVTGTVDSMPLIASSIMSKKLAAGSQAIVLDVKYGSGAFMKTPEDAVALAQEMIAIGASLGRSVRAVITDKDEPLGRAIGNALEVREAIDTLKGHGPEDLTQLCLTAGSMLLVQARIAENEDQAVAMLQKSIDDGTALEKLRQMVKAQGGNTAQIDDPRLLPASALQTELLSQQNGFITHMQAMQLGTQAMKIGAGRATKEDQILPGTGIVLSAKVGDYVTAGQPLAVIHHEQPLQEDWVRDFYACYTFGSKAPSRLPLIYKKL